MKETIKYWKKKAWDEFSLFIRHRDALRSTITGENAKCCTCNVEYPVKKLQAGHFNPGRRNSILFDERGCHAQCYNCNINLKGNPRKYDKFMREVYGQEIIDELDSLSEQTKQMKWFQFKEIYEHYKKLNDKNRR
jgi:hypothetical protein